MTIFELRARTSSTSWSSGVHSSTAKHNFSSYSPVIRLSYGITKRENKRGTAMPGLKPKRRGLGLEMRTFTGAKTGNVYTVLRTTRGSFHVLVETEAKAAARDCGAQGGGNTR